MSMTHKPYGTLADGTTVTEYTLTNASGASVSILDFGGTITRILVPDREGVLGDVNLSFDDPKVYEAGGCGSMGALIGRFGNRIAGAAFTLEGQDYHIGQNDGPNSLHGGMVGYNRRMWQAQPTTMDGADALALTLVSPDGEEGFPGTLSITVTYTFDDENALTIDYRATTDKPTLVNLTNHAYFNLEGHAAGSIHQQELQLFADSVTEVGEGLIPTGRLIPSGETVYGFTQPTPIGDVLRHLDSDPALKAAGGVDFNYCMGRDRETKLCATLYSPATGREMQVITDQPGVQIYMGQFLHYTGKDGAKYGPFGGICLETQHYPDAIHHPHFHSVVLRPQDTYATRTTYRFGIR